MITALIGLLAGLLMFAAGLFGFRAGGKSQSGKDAAKALKTAGQLAIEGQLRAKIESDRAKQTAADAAASRAREQAELSKPVTTEDLAKDRALLDALKTEVDG